MLTQGEADSLIKMKKRFDPMDMIKLNLGTDVTYDLHSDDKHEVFLLDVWRATLRISKVRFQNRGRKVIVLVRLDIDGSPHTNPDGKKIGGTHLHLYKEGFDSKWAYPIDPNNFPHISSISESFADFCRFCNIEDIPKVQEGLI